MLLNYRNFKFINLPKKNIVEKIISKNKKKQQVNFINPHSLVCAKRDFFFSKIISNSEFNFIDGVGLSIMLFFSNLKKVFRNRGYDIFIETIKKIDKNSKILFIGSDIKTLKKIKSNCRKNFKLNNVEIYSPPYRVFFEKKDYDKILNIVEKVKPKFIFVGVTAPKQEKISFFIKTRSNHNFHTIFSIGAVFDYFSGNVKTPFLFVQNLGLEWLLRLLKSPKKISSRVFFSGPIFFYDLFHSLLFKEKTKSYAINQKFYSNTPVKKMTIVTVVKNNNSKIEMTMLSVLEKLTNETEYLIIDGNSNDGTYEKILEVLKFHKNKKLVNVVRSKDKTVYDSLNIAMNIAKGKYITFLHAGDFYLENNFIKIALDNIKLGKDVYYSKCIYYSIPNIERVWIPEKKINNLNSSDLIPHTSVILKKSLKDYVGLYDESYKISADFKFLRSLYYLNLDYHYINNLTLAMHGTGLSTKYSFFLKKIVEDIRVLFHFHNLFFVWFYIKKILIKIPSFTFPNKNSYLSLFKKAFAQLSKLSNNIYMYNLFFTDQAIIPEIRLITDVKKIPFKKNFVLSGLNLAFIGSFAHGAVPLNKTIYHWPDGLFHYTLFPSGAKNRKIPGRELLDTLQIPSNIKSIRVIGNMSVLGKKYLEKRYKRKIFHTKIGFEHPVYEINKIKSINKNEIIIMTLPSPKQENLAMQIIQKFNNYKILCIGGALNICSGEESEVPKVMDNLGLEFIWRLRTDTKRRIGRLFSTFFGYLKFKWVLNKNPNKIKLKLI